MKKPIPLILLVLVAVTPFGWAQDTKPKESKVDPICQGILDGKYDLGTRFEKLAAAGCLGHERCTASLLGTTLPKGEKNLCVLVGEFVNPPKLSGKEEKEKEKFGPRNEQSEQGFYLVPVINRIVAGINQIPITDDTQALRDRLVAEIDETKEKIWAAKSIRDLPVSEWHATPTGDMFRNSDDNGISFYDTLDEACSDPNTGDWFTRASVNVPCLETAESIDGLYSHVALMDQVLSKALAKPQQTVINYLEDLDKQWDSYHLRARSQYPWELVVNTWIYDKSNVHEGFPRPPTWQLIVAHPSSGFEFSDEYDNEKLYEAFVFEGLGVYTWGFKDGELDNTWGGSLVGTWRNHPEGEHLGYGLIAHAPRNWSVGATWRNTDRGDEYSLLLNLDVAKWLMGEGRFQKKLREELNLPHPEE